MESFNAAGESFRHFEADKFFEDAEGNYNFDGSKIKLAHDWCQASADLELSFNNSVIVSNTFTTSKELRPYFTIARHYGIIPQVILCQNSFGSIHNVPETVMENMRKRFEYNIDHLYSEI